MRETEGGRGRENEKKKRDRWRTDNKALHEAYKKGFIHLFVNKSRIKIMLFTSL